jgi:uncharacterized FAD-dependent dehydrogenase
MPQVELFLPIDELEVDLRERAAAAAGVRPGDVSAATVIRRSLDARKGRPLGYRLLVELDLAGAVAKHVPPRPAPARTLTGERVVVVGSGPAGTFAALRLAEAGARVTIVEQGKTVQPRRHDLAGLVRRGTLDTSSNYCFGEGGAGTFSDGKLYTRVKDRAAVREVLDLLVLHGADPDILVDSRPHVGSNKLPLVLTGLRERLESLGVVYRWSEELVGVGEGGGGALLRSGELLPATRVVLAVGHSARATYERLVAAGVATEVKPFAIGARVEHPQPLIDEIQYGAAAKHPRLPAAFYQLTAEVEERGCWSFCMCPGGWIVNSSTEPERLATNGMSLKRRDSPFANSALVVTVTPADVGPGPLAGLAFQRRVEEAAFRLGGGGFRAPAQRLTDFVAGRATTVTGRSSYRPGIVGADLRGALPPFVVDTLRRALRAFDRTMKGFYTGEAQLVGVETRTSSPLRILRDAETLASPSHPLLYPCGEGAGYAGGIVSAAIDGLRVAEAIIRRG